MAETVNDDLKDMQDQQSPKQNGPQSPSKKDRRPAKDDHPISSIPKHIQEQAIEIGIANSEGWQQLEQTNAAVQGVISNLDTQLNNVLRKQEYQYLQAYNIYVKKKEKELIGLINQLEKNNEVNNVKGIRIAQLEVTIDQMRKDIFEQEQKIIGLNKDLKNWKEKHKSEVEEKEFYHKQALDAKRKNKLLKVAISRVQADNEQTDEKSFILPKSIRDGGRSIDFGNEKDVDNTFLTGANIDQNQNDSVQIDNFENSQALVEQNLLNNQQSSKSRFKNAKSAENKKPLHQRTKSQGVILSNYKNIPTENIKFQQFIDLIFESKMSKDDIKFEILNYTQALETNYMNNISDLKIRNERLKIQLRKEKSRNVNDVIERGDLENLFVECVEDVRRNVIKRRLKAEIIGKKKIGKFDENSEEAKEFEESLLKLANLAKNRVKFSEFTSQDRNNLLDLFVNNEKTLLRIYENLFPKRSGQQAQNTNSLKHLNTLKNSSDTIKFGNKQEFLKGDSLHQRSLDETQANTEFQNNSTFLPSILPAMNSIQSNDLMTSKLGAQNTLQHLSSPGNDASIGLTSINHEYGGSNIKFSQLNLGNSSRPAQNNQFNIGYLNQKSQNIQQANSNINLHH